MAPDEDILLLPGPENKQIISNSLVLTKSREGDKNTLTMTFCRLQLNPVQSLALVVFEYSALRGRNCIKIDINLSCNKELINREQRTPAES